MSQTLPPESPLKPGLEGDGGDQARSMEGALAESRRPLSAHVHIDDAHDILTVFGVKIAAPMLRRLSYPTPKGQWFRVVKIEGGVATIETKTDP